MLLNKTGKARDALREGTAAGLDLQARRILILVDGKRSLDQVMALLGGDILPAVDRLLREGYLARGDQASPDPSSTSLGGAVTGLVRAAADVVQARADRIRAGGAAAPAVPDDTRAGAMPAPPDPANASTPRAQAHPAHPTGARRSLAACKMYLLDMLQLQRTPEAAELRAAIQCATDPALLVDALLQALRMIVATSNASYGERVTQRLLEILPLESLPRLEAMRAERSGTPPSLSVVA